MAMMLNQENRQMLIDLLRHHEQKIKDIGVGRDDDGNLYFLIIVSEKEGDAIVDTEVRLNFRFPEGTPLSDYTRIEVARPVESTGEGTRLFELMVFIEFDKSGALGGGQGVRSLKGEA